MHIYPGHTVDGIGTPQPTELPGRLLKSNTYRFFPRNKVTRDYKIFMFGPLMKK